jgi:NodT family efflux transporter outer membrane factor (OMF) lipoprotein
MRRPLKFLALSALLALLASGCTTVGPDYRVPTAPVQDNWLEYEDSSFSTAPVSPEWWKTAFKDPILDRLVKTALAQNLSLRSAGLRVLQTRQQLAIAMGNQYPQQQQISGQAAKIGGNKSESYETYDMGFNLSWEADVWGRFRRQIESASATLDASVGSYDGIMVSLIAEVAQTYLLIRTTQQRLAVAEYNLKLQQQSLQITTAKFEGGEVSVLDVEQARTLYYNTQASLASLELSLQQLKNSLAILLGRPPHDMRTMLGPVQPIPTITPAVAVGMPQKLIRRRPDIRTAERQLAAQSAQIGFAVSDLYPQFSIGGSISTRVSTEGGFRDFGDLFTAETTSRSLFGAFQWNIFQYGRLKNNIRLQDAVFQQLLEDYRQTVLQAQGEVENAIVAFFKSQQQQVSLQSATSAAQRAVDVATVQYQEGEVTFNTLITTLQSLVSQQDQLAANQGTIATNLVDLYKSLGGGWELRSIDPLDLIDTQTRQEMLERTTYWEKTFKTK